MLGHEHEACIDVDHGLLLLCAQLIAEQAGDDGTAQPEDLDVQVGHGKISELPDCTPLIRASELARCQCSTRPRCE
jgi:hypothetical protein